MKTKVLALSVLICLVFCSCTVQTDFDVFDFCERYNSLTEEKILSTDSFLSDKNGGLYSFMTVNESRLLLTLKTDENTAVNSFYVTAQRDKYSQDDNKEVIKTVLLLFAAFDYGNTEKATENLASVGFDDNFEPFSSDYRSEVIEKYTYTLYSDEYSFTVCAEKNKSD